MKLNIKSLPLVGALAVAALSMGSCTDEIAFGNKFLEKAPGGTVTADTIFHSAAYARYYLNQCYTYQYYNMPVKGTNNYPQWVNWFKGMPDALADTHHICWSNTELYSNYYGGMLNASSKGVYPYAQMYMWENVRTCNLILERIGEVPDMTDAEREIIKDEARCLLVSNYFNMFRFYGGLPLVDFTFNGNESNYKGRVSAQETIDFMLDQLNTVIAGNHLPWAYTGADAQSETGHWTMAGAKALKIQVLQFAASPLLNSAQPYYQQDGYTMEHPEYVWLGGYDSARWDALYDACKDFFDDLSAKGHYALTQPTDDTAAAYSFAFRSSVMLQGSTDIIHSVRISSNALDNDYGWMYAFTNKASSSVVGQNGYDRLAYNPVQEYIEMFPWADGTPFDWDKTEAEGKLDEMFIKGERVYGQRDLQNVQYTRDPRLYEVSAVNGQRAAINWNNGERSGQTYEGWVGGTVAGQDAVNNSNVWTTGYRNLRYLAGSAFLRQKPQWVQILLAEIKTAYAEAILQSGKAPVADAIQQIDDIRARVGMKGLVECNPDKNLLTDKNALLEEILRERACELPLQMVRYFDLIRYKRADLFEKTLHGLLIYRLDENGQRVELPWYNGQRSDNSLTPDDENFYEPTHFDYVKTPIKVGARVWWTNGFNSKWYFQPFPITEVNKNYGLDQNPGW